MRRLVRHAALLAGTFLLENAHANINFLQDCFARSVTEPDIMKTYECKTRQEKAQGAEWKLNTPSTFTNCTFIGCGNFKFTGQGAISMKDVVFKQGDSVAGCMDISGPNVEMNRVIMDTCSTTGNGAAIQMTGGQLVIRDSTFINNIATTGNGGAIHVNGGQLVIRDSSFINNMAIKGATNMGGAIYGTNQTSISIYDSKFENNTADHRGGAVYVDQDAKLTLERVNFARNRAVTSRGMDMYIFQSTLNWNGGASVGSGDEFQGFSGGSVGVDNGEASLTQLTFSKQRVSLYGGILYAIGGSQVDMTHISGYDIYAAGRAGAIDNLGSVVTCTHCYFENLRTDGFGGIAYNTGTLTLVNVTSVRSSAAMAGSAIFNAEAATVNIRASNFTGSHFTGSSVTAGTVYSSGNLDIETSIFSNCNATVGPAIVSQTIANAGVAQVNISNLVCRNNHAADGGIVYLINSQSILTNISLINNTAEYGSSGLSLQSWDRIAYPTTLLGKIEIINNTVTNENGAAGAIYMDTQASLYINTSDITITGNKAAKGDCIYSNVLYDGNSYGLIDYSPPENQSTKPVIEGTAFFYHEAFAKYLHSTGVFSRMSTSVHLESRPVGANLVSQEAQTALQNYQVGNDFVLPTLELIPYNAFGVAVKSLYEHSIVTLNIMTTNGTKILSVYKAAVPGPAGVITFKGVTIPPTSIPAGFDGTIKITTSTTNQNTNGLVAMHSESTNTLNLVMKIKSCDSEMNALVAVSKSSNGKTVYACVPKYATASSARLIIFLLSLISMMATVGMWVFAYTKREFKVYRSFSHFFMTLITLGCMLQLLSLAVRGFFNEKNSSAYPCMAIEWLEILGFSLVMFSLIVKTYRIKAIFINTLRHRGRAEAISNEVLFYRILLLMVFVVIFLTVWQVQAPLMMTSMAYGGKSGWLFVDQCLSMTSLPIFQRLSVALHIGLVCVAAYYAYSTRFVPSAYNETKTILLISYAWLICSGILYPMGEYIFVYPTSLFFLQTLRILLPVVFTLVLLHVPRIHMVITNPKKAQESSHSLGKTYKNSNSLKTNMTMKSNGSNGALAYPLETLHDPQAQSPMFSSNDQLVVR